MHSAVEDLIDALEALLDAASQDGPRPQAEPLEDWASRHGLEA